MRWKCISKMQIWRLTLLIKEIRIKIQSRLMKINNLLCQTNKIQEKKFQFQQIHFSQKCYSPNKRNLPSARWKTYSLYKSKSSNGFNSRLSSGWAMAMIRLEKKIWCEKTEKSVDSMNNRKLMSSKRPKWMNSPI